MATKRQVIAALRAAFPDVDVSSVEQIENRHVLGIVVSKAFDRRDHLQRQRLIRKALAKSLGKDGFSNVGPLAALTPAEAEIRTQYADV